MSIDFENLSYEEARVYKEQLEDLFDNAGWQFFTEFVEERVSGRMKELLNLCPESVEEMVRYARVKGAIDELSRLVDMLAQVHSDLATEVKRLQEEENENAAMKEETDE